MATDPKPEPPERGQRWYLLELLGAAIDLVVAVALVKHHYDNAGPLQFAHLADMFRDFSLFGMLGAVGGWALVRIVVTAGSRK